MNIQGANLLSLLSGSENLGNLQQGLLSETSDQAGFASTLMEQLGVLQGNLAGGDAQQGLQNFAALFGKDLPVASKLNQDIDLEDTLQTLADVLKQLQQLDAGAETIPALSALSATTDDTDQKKLLTDSLKDAMDESATLNNPLAMPVSAQQVESVQLTDQPVHNAELSGVLFDSKKPAQILSQESQLKNSLTDASTAKSNDQEFDRSINAMMANDGADGKSQSDKSALGFKAENLVNQIDSQVGSQVDGTESTKTLPGVAADIAKLNNVVRGEAPAVQSELSKSFGDPAWNKELGEKLIWMHKQSMPSVELRLNPEHLGPVLIKIDISHDQANIAFTAQHLAVKEAIEAAIPKLREMLNGQQLNLADVNVSQQQSDQRQPAREFFQMASDQGRGHSSDLENSGTGPVNEAQNVIDEIEAGRAVASNGLLSLFA